MSSVNPYDDHINTYNMIKQTFIQNIYAIENVSNILLIRK